ncbi:MAG: putative transrane two component system sensor kinase transcription regulator protein [Gemmatimonadetes bacterium]|nr:putative transrane two component system sensor kinase transcription regulator protein [Gemmatimonadota bacterium]
MTDTDAEIAGAQVDEHPPIPPRPSAPGGKVVRLLLRVPLFYKILLANGVLVLVGGLAGGLLTAQYVRAAPGRSAVDVVGLLAAAGVFLSLAVNALILRVALSPLQLLENTAGRVQGGDLDARVPISPLADRELDRLSRTFNAMLDTSAADRNRLRDVAKRALGAAEEERKRIARELHDETAQRLAALLIRLRILRGAGADAAGLEAGLEALRAEIGEALEGVRRYARGLRPPALDELGLVPAIESHVRWLTEATGLAIDAAADGDVEGLLPPEGELAVYRIVQEALSNVVRHSGARRVSVRLGREPGMVAVTVQDDGHGFSPRRVMSEDGSGLGLFGMQERAAYLGGRVEVESRPGAGTRVRAEIPVPRATDTGP